MKNSGLRKFFSNFLANPLYFCLRQVYRIFIIFPFNAIVYLLFRVNSEEIKMEDRKPTSFCFIITSVVYPKHNKTVSFGGARSVFAPGDRATQTLHTIETIRQKIPSAKIVLVEGGVNEQWTTDIKDKVDRYVYVGNKRLVRWACDSASKSLGEVVMVLYGLKHIPRNADLYFKMSGRYYLNDKFNLNNWHGSGFFLQFKQEDYVCTRLYGFSKELFDVWKLALIKSLPFSLIGYAIENTLSKFVPHKYVRKMEQLGVTGIGASQNDILID